MTITQLNTAAGGINRQRIKGGPSPQNLYDLLNGYVDGSGAVQSRPGTRGVFALPPGTKGMCAFNGGLVVFSHAVIGEIPEGVTLEVLTHPNNSELPIKEIHFAGPFLGSLYVTAEFEGGDVFDYWLRSSRAWEADTFYLLDDMVQPTDPNGYMYRPHRLGDPGVTWEPNAYRAVGDVVEPTTFNGFEYVAVEVHGSPPRSGAVEPDWPTSEGAVVVEESDAAAPPPPQQQPVPSVPPRYGNPGGVPPPKGDHGGGGPSEQER